MTGPWLDMAIIEEQMEEFDDVFIHHIEKGNSSVKNTVWILQNREEE
jgi:hypothetical protein